MLSGKQSDLDLMSTDVFTRFSQLILDLLSFLKITYPVSAGQGFIHHFMGHWQTVHRGFIKRREAGIFPFYSGMFPLLLLMNLCRVYRQILSNHPPILP